MLSTCVSCSSMQNPPFSKHLAHLYRQIQPAQIHSAHPASCLALLQLPSKNHVAVMERHWAWTNKPDLSGAKHNTMDICSFWPGWGYLLAQSMNRTDSGLSVLVVGDSFCVSLLGSFPQNPQPSNKIPLFNPQHTFIHIIWWMFVLIHFCLQSKQKNIWI